MIRCKCCGNKSEHLGFVDFSKSCQDRHGVKIFKSNGNKVSYLRCSHCGFIFTTLCDGWTSEDFKNKIYNKDYYKADGVIPGTEGRNLGYESGLQIAANLRKTQENIDILDFGSGGNPGNFGKALIDKGFRVTSYDPFMGDASVIKEDKKFDFIISIEVFEHCHDLENVLRLLDRHSKKDCIVFFSTMLHENVPDSRQLESWYIAPRNGHISIFTFEAVWVFFRRIGFNVVKTPVGLLAVKGNPNFGSAYWD